MTLANGRSNAFVKVTSTRTFGASVGVNCCLVMRRSQHAAWQNANRHCCTGVVLAFGASADARPRLLRVIGVLAAWLLWR